MPGWKVVVSFIRRSGPVRACARPRPSSRPSGEISGCWLFEPWCSPRGAFPDEEVHAPACRLAARHECGGTARGDCQPGHLLGDVGALGEDGYLLGEALLVHRDAARQLGHALGEPLRYSSTDLGTSSPPPRLQPSMSPRRALQVRPDAPRPPPAHLPPAPPRACSNAALHRLRGRFHVHAPAPPSRTTPGWLATWCQVTSAHPAPAPSATSRKARAYSRASPTSTVGTVPGASASAAS